MLQHTSEFYVLRQLVDFGFCTSPKYGRTPYCPQGPVWIRSSLLVLLSWYYCFTALLQRNSTASKSRSKDIFRDLQRLRNDGGGLHFFSSSLTDWQVNHATITSPTWGPSQPRMAHKPMPPLYQHLFSLSSRWILIPANLRKSLWRLSHNNAGRQNN